MSSIMKTVIAIAVSIMMGAGCSGPQKVADGDTVRVHFTGTLEDGSIFDSSRDREPLQFVVGSGNVIKGFDEAVIGMEVGQSKTITLPPEKAYGFRDDRRITKFPRSQFPESIELKEGMHLTAPGGMPVTVLEIGVDSVTIDTNHPLAEKTLTFEIELVAINPLAEGE